MQDFVKWAKGSASVREETVGPKHDPYSRKIVSLTFGTATAELYECALAGEWLVVNGRRVYEKEDFMFSDPEMKTIATNTYNEMVKNFTGQTAQFWMDRLWDKVRAARERNNPDYYMYMGRDPYFGGE